MRNIIVSAPRVVREGLIKQIVRQLLTDQHLIRAVREVLPEKIAVSVDQLLNDLGEWSR